MSIPNATTESELPQTWKETRRSGRPFEAFAKQCLEHSLARPLDPLQSASPVARLLSDNACNLYKPFSAVPARILAKVDYIGHGAVEYARILNDATQRPDRCGYTERGGDGMLERKDNGGFIVLQDKDHKHLDRADLTSFLDFTADCVAYNIKLGMERNDVHGLLIFPEDSRVGEGSRIMMERRKRRGVYSLALQGFQPRNIQDDDCPAFALSGDLDEVAPTADHLIAPAIASKDVEMDDPEIDIESASRPLGGENRAFQQLAAQRIVAKAGFHLIHGPPGVGKTCILAHATGALVLPEGRQTRRSVPQGELYVKTVALMTAPYVTHARQLYWRMKGVLGANFGPNWQKFAAFLACETVNKQPTRCGGNAYVSKDVPTKAEALHAFRKGTSVFVSTEDSSELLFDVAEAARKAGCRLLVIKDEAHFASTASSWSTKLMSIVDSSKGDRAILATATPNFEVMRFPFVMWPVEGNGGGSVNPLLAITINNAADKDDEDVYDEDGYEHSFYMSIAEAIERGYCCDYRILLPQVTDISTGEDVPVKVRDVVKAHNVGNAAMMTLQAMHAEGKRRCIAYADDSVESAKDAVAALKSVCETAFEPVYGIQCIAHVITHETSPTEREARFYEFENGPIETEPDENGVCFPIFRFLVAVRILDQCVDMPITDAVSIMCPPTSTASVLSAHRAIQRLGRALRPKPNGSIFCIYTDRDNVWLSCLLDVLDKYDPGVERRLCMRSSNPSTAYEATTTASEEADTQAAHVAYRVHAAEVEKRTEGYRNEQIKELKRLILLVHAKAVDPNTRKLAHMPFQLENQLGLGNVWHGMKSRSRRKAELVAVLTDTGIDLDAFIASGKREQPDYTKEEQIEEMKRLVILVHAKAVDPKTDKLAHMPSQREKQLGLGNVWSDMKSKGTRKAELAAALADTGIDLDAFIASERCERVVRDYTNDEQIEELKRLIIIVHAKAVDPKTGNLAQMPSKGEKQLGLGKLWQHMKDRGTRKAELAAALADTGIDLDAFIASEKRERVVRDYTNEDQIEELKRLIILVHAKAVDPKTGNLAQMPSRREKQLGLGHVWSDMKSKGTTRKAELVTALTGSGIDIDAFIASEKREQPDYTKEEQIEEMKRLVILVHAKAVDPKTGNLAQMPSRREKQLGLGHVWSDMKSKGTNKGPRKAELAAALADTGIDLDAFISDCKRKFKARALDKPPKKSKLGTPASSSSSSASVPAKPPAKRPRAYVSEEESDDDESIFWPRGKAPAPPPNRAPVPIPSSSSDDDDEPIIRPHGKAPAPPPNRAPVPIPSSSSDDDDEPIIRPRGKAPAIPPPNRAPVPMLSDSEDED